MIHNIAAPLAACFLAIVAAVAHAAEPGKVSLSAFPSPILFRGDATTAYRDPAVIFSERDPRGGFDNFASIGLAWSNDLKTWGWPGQE